LFLKYFQTNYEQKMMLNMMKKKFGI